MLLHSTILLLFCACAKVKGQRGYDEAMDNDISNRLDQLEKAEPEEDNSCYVTRSNEPPTWLVTCPTYVTCYIYHGSPLDGFSGSTYEDVCISLDGVSLPLKKKRQLNAVLDFFGVTKESTCDFGSIEILIARDEEPVFDKILKFIGVSCHSECPSYNLTYMSLGHLNIEHVPNDAFCQLGQLKYLELFDCNIGSVDEDAFTNLVNLNNVSLSQNNLTYLPANLFIKNVHLRHVDLSENQLQTRDASALFKMDSLKTLILNSNQIDFTAGHVTFPKNLEKLEMDDNEVRVLKLELRNLSKLLDLQMHDNGVIEVDVKAFYDTCEIRIINLGSNEIERLSMGTFENTLKLEELRLNANKLSEFPPIGHLTSLKELEVSHNSISSINKTHLFNCTGLTFIELSSNRLSFIEEGSFDNTKELKALYLYHNQLSELSADFKTFRVLELYLDHNEFASFSLEMVPLVATTVRVSFNQIETIEAFKFQGQRWSLKYLDLSYNKIRSVKNLTLPLSIEEIDLSGNGIDRAITLNDVNNQKLYNLRSIDLQHNNISSFCRSAFEKLNSNLRIDYYLGDNPLLCNNELKWLKDYEYGVGLLLADKHQISCLPVGPYDDSEPVPLNDLSDDRFLSRSDHSNSDRCLCPQPNGGLRCQLPCPYNCTCYSNYVVRIIYIMCNSRGFARIPNGLMYLKEYRLVDDIRLDFGGNLIPHVKPVNFGALNKKIDILRLTHCQITSIDSEAFDNLTRLTGLNLASNQLESLPETLFHNLIYLSSLDLSNNRLTRLADDAFKSFDYLNELYLHNNSFNRLQIDQILIKSLTNVTLNDNPWSCDCTFIKPFQEFLYNSSTAVYNKENINCAENGEWSNIPNFYMEHCNKIQMVYHDHSAIWIPSLIIGLVLIVVAGLVFKWRYELQVLVYSRYGLRMFHRRQHEEDEGKQFDVFMAYSSKDEDFLVEQLLPGLERIENPYRVLIHERDFLAGGYIQDNILEAIKISSRTIVVLSENFVQSGWCRFEFKTAHVQMMEDRCPRLLVIVVGDIPETLEPEMQLYLKTNTYLVWGERLFWEKLYYALPEQRVTTPTTHNMPTTKF